jgi:hypothetical protein
MVAKKEKATTEKKPKKKKEPKEEKVKEIGLFDILRFMFTDMNKLKEVPKNLLDRNFFMINRILGIQYPMQAQIFQTGKVNNIEVVYCWADYLQKSIGYLRVPGFVFTKGVQRSKDEVESKKKVPESLIKSYANYYKLSIKDIHSALYFYPDLMESEIKNFEKFLNGEVVKQIKKK